MRNILSRIYRNIPLPLVRLVLRIFNARFCITVAGIFFTTDKRVLVLRHVYRHKYPWGLPSGFLEAGESPEQGVLRELKEETGLDGRVHSILTSHLLYPRHLEVVLVGAVDANQPVRLSHEIFEVAFVAPTALPDATPPGQKDLIRRATASPVLSQDV